MDLKKEFFDTVEDALRRTGRELGDSADSVRTYASERLMHLSTMADAPDFSQAVQIEAMNVALKAAGAAVDAADATDALMVGIISGALRMGARALIQA